MAQAPSNRTDTPPEQSGDWYHSEPRIGRVLIFELQRFKLRMKAHPIPVLLLAALLTAGTLAYFVKKPRRYTARVILRISEGALSQYEGPVLPSDDLKSYIYDFALPDPVLLDEVIEGQGFFRRELDKFGPDVAIDELREGLSVDVFDNYFFFSKDYEPTPRSLRVAIIYAYTDPDVAYNLARALADLVIEVESQKRTEEMRFAAVNARTILEQAERVLIEQEETLSKAESKMLAALRKGDQSEAALIGVEMDRLRHSVTLQKREVDNLQWEVEAIERDQRLAEQRLGLLFETAGEMRPRVQSLTEPLLLTLIGLVGFCVFVPMCAIALGTIDSRIHEAGDVRRLGMPVVGHIPGFPGDQVGSLQARGALEPPGPLARLGLGPKRRIRSTSSDRVA